MKIDSDFIKKIFNLKIKLTKNEDKIKLSKYQEEIPMYDIYSQKIYPINKQNLHYRLIESHYRFVNNEIYEWLTTLYNKYKDDRFKYNLEIMNNYDIATLIETSYKTFYKYSPQLGLLVSICKRNSFNPYIQHLKPYYTKLELIKLGQNMNLKVDVELDKLVDKYYDICVRVSNNDVSFKEIKKHHQYIFDSNIISWICFYSLTGSFLFNKYLRNTNVNAIRRVGRTISEKQIHIDLYNGLYDIVKIMENSPVLEDNFEIYRFIWDDSFLINLMEGDIFMDKGFVSTTRDPFYSPGLNGNFGLILLKINIPKNRKGLGLFVENFSLFPKEEEFLLPPYSRIKLKSKNENFKYYHTNSEFERLINRKYEFELIDIDYKLFYKENPKINPERVYLDTELEEFDIETIELEGNDRIDIIRAFMQKYANNNKVNLSGYKFNCNWFDSSSISAYEKFYYNKTRDGFQLTLMDKNGYPYLNIEIGNDLVINYLNKLYFGKSSIVIGDKELLNLVYHIGRIFYYKKALIFHNHSSFDEFHKNYNKEDRVFLSMNLYNNMIYNYLKSNKKMYEDNPFISYDIGYWYLDSYFDKPPEFTEEYKTNKELFIDTVEKKFNFYPKMIENMDKNIFRNTYYTYNIYEQLSAEGLITNFKPDIGHSGDDNRDDNFKLIFRQPIRRL